MPSPSSTPRIVVVTQRIAQIQSRRTDIVKRLAALKTEAEKLDVENDKATEEQTILQREMDKLTSGAIVTK